LSARGFVSRLTQAAGRERHDLTVTEVNLFHIRELAYGIFNHRPYNLGWGHHHCNVVCKDSGIDETLRWMESVIERNKSH
jgi:BstXI restriction endonuclease